MRFYAVLAVATAGLVALVAAVPVHNANTAPVLDDSRIDSINSKGLGWTAGRNERFDGVSLREAKRLLGVVLPEAVSCPKDFTFVETEAVPESFDSRKQWPKFIHGVLDQQQCGSCWAFAASEVFSDRMAIASNGSINEVFSPEALVACDTKDSGCDGGYPTYAADYIVSHGLPTLKCEPYVSGGGDVPSCAKKCKDGSAIKVHKYKSWDYCIGEAAMKAALQHGPVAVAFAVYEDFFSYKKGVYKWDGESALAGYHAVKLLGYGEEKAECTGTEPCAAPKKYWIVQNSWGTSWGIKGTFLIARGINECGIEKGPLDRGCPLAGTPLV